MGAPEIGNSSTLGCAVYGRSTIDRFTATFQIFIDKLNVSGIEIMILDWPLQKIPNGAAIYWRNASVEEGLDLHRIGPAAT